MPNEFFPSASRFSRRALWRTAAVVAALLAFPRSAPATGSGAARQRFPLLRGWSVRPSPAGRADAVDLPHSPVQLPWRDWEPASWERSWHYEKTFAFHPQRGMRYFLDFDGVLTSATPVLNGHELPQHRGGYLPFRYEVTDLLRTENHLAVTVDGAPDPEVPPNHGPGQPSSAVDFWQPAGMYREVWLTCLPADHISDVFAKPVEVLDERRRGLVVQCELDLAVGGPGYRLGVELRRDGVVLAATSRSLAALPPGRHTVRLGLERLSGIELWHVSRPELYDVVVTLSAGGSPVHDYRVRTGFREAVFTTSGCYLNGERLQVFGLNRHQLFPFVGAAMPARVQRRDAEMLRRELNCNMVRCSHYPQHPAFLDACDELGLMVWVEPPGWQRLGGREWLARSYRDVREMILRDRNHPSVVLWGARLNETPGNAEFYTATERLAKSLDDSRQTTGGMHPADHDSTDFQHDVFGYNDYAWTPGPDGAPQPEPLPPRTDFPYLISEAVGTLSGPAKFYRRTDRQPVQQGQALAHARVHDRAMRDPACTGVLAWCGFDYPSGNGNVFHGIKWPGVVDLFRVPKPGAAFYRAQVDPRQRVVIEPSFYWDFSIIPVTELGDRAAIWSNVDLLKIYLDGLHHSDLSAAREEFPHLAYPPFFANFSNVDPAELRIDGYLDGQLVASRKFCADRGLDRLELSVDSAALTAAEPDATRAELRATDRYGNNRPHVRGNVDLTLTGPAILIGANPFPLSETGGAGAVWLRSTGTPGTALLRAEHPVLGSATARIHITADPAVSG